jgi:hypothetical protein
VADALVLGITQPVRAIAGAHDSNHILTPADTALLDEVEKRAVLFFIEHSDQHTGLTEDRARNRRKRPADKGD